MATLNIPLQRKNERRARIGMSPYQAPDPQSQDMTKALLDWVAISQVPGIADVAGLLSDARMYQTQPESRGLLNYGMTALAMLPFVPSRSLFGKADDLKLKDPKDIGLGEIIEIPQGDGAVTYGLQSPNGLARATMKVEEEVDPAGNKYLRSAESTIDPAYQRQGLGTWMYNEIEKRRGIPFVPDSALSEAGASFWANRNPELLQGLLSNNWFENHETFRAVANALENQNGPMLPTDAQREAWRAANKGNFKKYQNPDVAQAARDLEQGKMSSAEYDAIVRELNPIHPITQVPELPSFYEIGAALDSNKVEKGIIGLNKTIPDGTMVGSRLDIPAYNNYNTWVVSLHEGSGVSGNSLGYGKTAVLDNVVFNSNPKAALNVATGKKPKAPFARMNGYRRNVDPEDARAMAQQYLNDPEWIQVGMNPDRHSFFYDKATGNALDSADQVVQIGRLVLAKNAKTRPLESPQHMIDTPAGQRFFSAAGGGLLMGGAVARQRDDDK